MQRARTARVVPAAALEPVYGNCTKETPRCADARDYNVDLRQCCRDHIRQIVADTVPVLRAHRVTFWADYGTLLGAVRNPLLGLPAGIIPHDKDADFGILAVHPSILERVARVLRHKGYYVAVRPFGNSLKVRLSETNHTNADFFAWHERPNSGMMFRRHYIKVDQYKGRDFPKAEIKDMSTVQWEGMDLPAPRDPAAFCEFRYGPSWRTPIRANNDGVKR